MNQPTKVLIEMASGQVIGVRSTDADVEIVVVDYDHTGQHFDDQECKIERHSADEDPDAVHEAIAALDPADADEG